jgi:hypothetical protein
VLPAGDLSIFADRGIDDMELAISGDLDLLVPGEALSIITGKLGSASPAPRPGQECDQGTRVARWW